MSSVTKTSLRQIFICTFLFLTTVWSWPSVSKRDINQATAKTSASNAAKAAGTAPFSVTGVQSGGIQNRLEIRDLAANKDAYNIFLLGLARMQQSDQSNYLSYFQLSGIHGRPMADWNGVAGNSSSPTPGWCTHVSNLFLPWHRPYLALYEMILVANAQDAANEFPAGAQRTKYLNAANNLRLPFWDWAKAPSAGANTIPSQLTDSQVSVVTPTGTKRIANPLASYKFHPTDAGLFYSIYIQWQQTLRWPNSLQSSASTQNSQLISAVNGNRQQWQQRLYNLFTQYNNYMDFTNEPFIKSAGPLQYDSIESLHDSIHNTVGGSNYGHMNVIDVSAFDPVFWLHHAMVDRIFALWQAVYPGSYVQPQSQYQASYWYKSGDTLDVNTELRPFHASQVGDFWTSASIRDHTKFGYSYSELSTGNPDDVRQAINNLYGPSKSSSSSKKAKRDMFTGSTQGPGNFEPSAIGLNMTSKGPALAGAVMNPMNPFVASTATNVTKPRDFLANIRAPKNGLHGSYSVHIFLGQPSSDPATWPHDPTLVGTFGVVSSLDGGSMNPVLVGGCVPLTARLAQLYKAGSLKDLKQDTIEQFLKNGLQWRIRQSDGTVVSPASIPDLAVSVVSTEIQIPQTARQFPKWVSKPLVHSAATAGKSGGVGKAEDA